jgi:glycerol-3-phosphate dehydrogenase (NAD(P)+)
MNLKAALLGGGSWGTTVASLIARNAPVTLWARDETTVEEINADKTNSKYLPGARLNSRLVATGSIEEAVTSCDVLVMGIPSQHFRSVLKQAREHLRPWVPVIINEEMPGHPVGVLTGPNLAREIIVGQAAASVMAMEDEIIVRELQQLFHSGLFRVYTNTDLIGCELGGVLKNIIAIAVGMGDGQGAGDNTRSALITRGLAEIIRLGVAMGGRPETFAGLAGMGDLIATCTSEKSRNHHVGFELGRGRTLEEIIEEMVMVAEGVKSAPTVMALGEEYGIEMPITRDVLSVLEGENSPRQAFRGLLKATVGAESEPG